MLPFLVLFGGQGHRCDGLALGLICHKYFVFSNCARKVLEASILSVGDLPPPSPPPLPWFIKVTRMSDGLNAACWRNTARRAASVGKDSLAGMLSTAGNNLFLFSPPRPLLLLVDFQATTKYVEEVRLEFGSVLQTLRLSCLMWSFDLLLG